MGMDLENDPNLWLCTTCMNCLRVCPKEVDMIKIMPAVREQAVGEGHVPVRAAGRVREDVPVRQLPRRERPPAPRLDQDGRRAGAGAVGLATPARSTCSSGSRTTGATTPVARRRPGPSPGWPPRWASTGPSSGPEEKTVADSQRLAGEKGLFEAMMEDVVATLGKYQFNRIVTPDPHAYNAFTKVYPTYGHEYEVLHYTQLLAPADGPGGVRRTRSTSTSPSTTPATSAATAASTTPPGCCSRPSPA